MPTRWVQATGLGLVLALAMLWQAPGALAQGAPPPSPRADQTAPQPSRVGPAQIDRNGVLILIRTVLLALDAANQTGNYTVLRDLGAPGFQSGNTAARLSEIFANLRNQKVDLSGVAVLDPQLTLLPQVEANGLMRMAGFFPSVPTQMNFEFLFAPTGGKWRLFGISVGLGQSGPNAPLNDSEKAQGAAAPVVAPNPTPPATARAEPSASPASSQKPTPPQPGSRPKARPQRPSEPPSASPPE